VACSEQKGQEQGLVLQRAASPLAGSGAAGTQGFPAFSVLAMSFADTFYIGHLSVKMLQKPVMPEIVYPY